MQLNVLLIYLVEWRTSFIRILLSCNQTSYVWILWQSGYNWTVTVVHVFTHGVRLLGGSVRWPKLVFWKDYEQVRIKGELTPNWPSLGWKGTLKQTAPPARLFILTPLLKENSHFVQNRVLYGRSSVRKWMKFGRSSKGKQAGAELGQAQLKPELGFTSTRIWGNA